MDEAERLTKAVAGLKTEVAEAVTKFSETAAALAEALKNDADLETLRASVAGAITELEGTSKHLDDKFATGTFVPSGN